MNKETDNYKERKYKTVNGFHYSDPNVLLQERLSMNLHLGRGSSLHRKSMSENSLYGKTVKIWKFCITQGTLYSLVV